MSEFFMPTFIGIAILFISIPIFFALADMFADLYEFLVCFFEGDNLGDIIGFFVFMLFALGSLATASYSLGKVFMDNFFN